MTICRRHVLIASVAAGLLIGSPGLAAETCNEITSNGNTFTLNQAYTCGQFATGDWWVIPPSPSGKVRITALSPSPFTTGCQQSGHHGWQINPPFGSSQSLDDRMANTFASAPCLPHDASPGDSIVKVKSWNTSYNEDFCKENSSTEACLENVAVLTVLSEPPADGSFRPPYVAGPKPIFSVHSLYLDALPRLPLISEAPSIDSVAAMLREPWLDHIEGHRSRLVHSRQGLRNPDGSPADYGSELLRLTAMMAMRSGHDEPDSEKLKLAVPLVQAGIDLYHNLLAGRDWRSHAGLENGRKLPILYAGLLLSHSGMSSIGTSHMDLPGDCTRYFSEDGLINRGEGGVPLFGDAREGLCGCGGKFGGIGNSRGDYQMELDQGCPGRRKSCRDPDGLNDGGTRVHGDLSSACVEISPPSSQISSNQWEQGSYQYCCTTAGFIGTSIAARLLGLRDEWNYEPFFEYADRMAGPPWNGAGAFGHAYMTGMYSAYRGCAGSCPGQGGGDPNRPEPPYVH